MPHRAPLPGSSPSLSPDLLAPIQDLRIHHAAMFNNRQRRLDRFARAGLATAAADFKLPGPDAAIANPLSGADADEIASLVMRIESFGGSPNGDIINTGSNNDRAILSGDGAGGIQLVVREGAGGDDIDSGIVLPDTDLTSGFHVYVVAFDPVNGQAKVYVDGRLVIDETDVGATKWASITVTWDYVGAATQIGTVEPLEVHLDKVPSIF